MRTGYDLKWFHRELPDEFRDDELQRIPLQPAHRLEQGARTSICASGASSAP